jgi:RHS repeat-associated protein
VLAVEENTDIHNPFGFTGYRLDLISGLELSSSRAYNPELGRFISADTHWHTGNMIYGDNLRYAKASIRVPSLLAIRQSSNLYGYTTNNPLIYVDPSGNRIRFCMDSTPEQINQFWDAVEYLETSETGAELLRIIFDAPEVITISFTDSFDERGVGFCWNHREIIWNPLAGAVLLDGSIMSPALGLAHEFGHAKQSIDGRHINEGIVVDQDNIYEWETRIARELGEFTRDCYYDAIGSFVRVPCVTAWGRYLWLCGDFSDLFGETSPGINRGWWNDRENYWLWWKLENFYFQKCDIGA